MRHVKKVVPTAVLIGTVHVAHQFGIGLLIEAAIRAALHHELIHSALGFVGP